MNKFNKIYNLLMEDIKKEYRMYGLNVLQKEITEMYENRLKQLNNILN